MPEESQRHSAVQDRRCDGCERGLPNQCVRGKSGSPVLAGKRRAATVMILMLCMDEIRLGTTLEPSETMTFDGIYRGIIMPGSRRWCKISSIHSTAANVTVYF